MVGAGNDVAAPSVYQAALEFGERIRTMTKTLATLAKICQGAFLSRGPRGELQVAQDIVGSGFALAHERWRGKAGEIEI